MRASERDLEPDAHHLPAVVEQADVGGVPDAVVAHDGLELVALSRGAAGSTWLTPTAQRDVATVKVAAVDTTGAGDGFMAGLISGLLADPTAPADPSALTAICRFANATGALTTTRKGAIPALPSRQMVEAFLVARS